MNINVDQQCYLPCTCTISEKRTAMNNPVNKRSPPNGARLAWIGLDNNTRPGRSSQKYVLMVRQPNREDDEIVG